MSENRIDTFEELREFLEQHPEAEVMVSGDIIKVIRTGQMIDTNRNIYSVPAEKNKKD